MSGRAVIDGVFAFAASIVVFVSYLVNRYSFDTKQNNTIAKLHKLTAATYWRYDCYNCQEQNAKQ